MPLNRISDSRHAIGGLCNWITFFSPGARNAVDGGNVAPSPAFSTWANIRALRGEELDKAQQIAQEVEHVITIAYQTGVSPAMTIEFESRMFQIKYVEDENEMHIFLDIYVCEIGQSAGETSS